ncbi:hypothetical protein [Luteimonas kalidii]|uniref:Uncharacterized protein n=1 Tax=Luteimonas kalidii TaxID=3042025 RepID=A0ABT6JWX6_9GAMM|nr:hypothetical protein [Luteimonas kalidii]MDH5835208.1 hypothetical protein [Luteimonas kalidii]
MKKKSPSLRGRSSARPGRGHAGRVAAAAAMRELKPELDAYDAMRPGR